MHGATTVSKDYHPSWMLDSEIDKDFDLGELEQSLVELKLQFCIIDTSVLDIICRQLPNLKKLDIYGNLLADLNENFEFYSLNDTLRELNIGWCCLISSSLLALKIFQNLTTLIADSNNFQNLMGELKMNCNNLKTVETLDMRWSYLEMQDVQVLSYNFPRIKKLNISDNTINSQQELRLSEMWKDSLEHLGIRKCTINKSVFEEIFNCRQLKYLDASGSDLSTFFTTASKGEAMNSLRVLKITGLHSYFTIEYLDIFTLTDIHISFYHSSINREKPVHFNNLNESLINLQIEHSQMDQGLYESISQFKGLETFKLHEVNCKQLTPEILQKYPLNNLQNLDIEFSDLDKDVIEVIKGWNIQNLNLNRHYVDPERVF